VEPIALDGAFRVLAYGLGHSQLLMTADPTGSERPHVITVLFETVTAVKLRRTYPGLTLVPAGEPVRTRLLDYADIPQRLRPAQVCLTLPTEDDGFVVCGRARVITGRQPAGAGTWRWPDDATVLHVVKGGPPAAA
jgi:hypothetical protein